MSVSVINTASITNHRHDPERPWAVLVTNDKPEYVRLGNIVAQVGLSSYIWNRCKTKSGAQRASRQVRQ